MQVIEKQRKVRKKKEKKTAKGKKVLSLFLLVPTGNNILHQYRILRQYLFVR